MFPVTLSILSFCIFRKAENAQISATFSGMTCPNNWAVDVPTLQIGITDPATEVTGLSSVTLTYQTKPCRFDVQSTSCIKSSLGCTDGIFSGISCTKTATTQLQIIWMAPAPLTIDQHDTMITITNTDSQISGWTDDSYTLNVIHGPTTLDGNAETNNATHSYNDVASFTCSSGFTGSSFERSLSACAEWTKRSTDPVNDCTAVVCSRKSLELSCSPGRCCNSSGSPIDNALFYNQTLNVQCCSGYEPVNVSSSTQCIAMDTAHNDLNCSVPATTAIPATPDVISPDLSTSQIGMMSSTNTSATLSYMTSTQKDGTLKSTTEVQITKLVSSTTVTTINNVSGAQSTPTVTNTAVFVPATVPADCTLPDLLCTFLHTHVVL